MDYKIESVFDNALKNIHHIGVACKGVYYSVIFGLYINGGFCYIPNFRAACELSDDLTETGWNKVAISDAINDERAGETIADAIAFFIEQKGDK